MVVCKSGRPPGPDSRTSQSPGRIADLESTEASIRPRRMRTAKGGIFASQYPIQHYSQHEGRDYIYNDPSLIDTHAEMAVRQGSVQSREFPPHRPRRARQLPWLMDDMLSVQFPSLHRRVHGSRVDRILLFCTRLIQPRMIPPRLPPLPAKPVKRGSEKSQDDDAERHA